MSAALFIARDPIDRHGERRDEMQAFRVRAARAPAPAEITVAQLVEEVGRATGIWWSYDHAEQVARLILQRERDAA